MRNSTYVLFGLCLLFCLVGEAPAHAKRHAVRHGYGVYLITYYYPTGYPTSTGYPARWGEVAVDPAIIPLGAHVRIEGITPIDGQTFTFRARDTGGAVRGNHIDVLVYSYFQGQRLLNGTVYHHAYFWL